MGYEVNTITNEIREVSFQEHLFHIGAEGTASVRDIVFCEAEAQLFYLTNKEEAEQFLDNLTA